MACLFGHKWDGCKCAKCGKTRDEQHDWDLCKGKCKRCGKPCDEQHEWDGCKCKRCGEVRDEQHNWDGCKCRRCGKVRNEQHDWDSIEGECKICKSRCEPHEYGGCVCKRCGFTRHNWGSYVKGSSLSSKTCIVCGEQFVYWYGNKYGAISHLHDMFIAKDAEGIKNLGLRLYELNDTDRAMEFLREVGGGFARMYPRDASTLNHLWNGIGDWGSY